MTSIPANVQNFPAGNRTGQPKVQAAESKEDFGKVLDRQKTGTSGDSSVKAPKQAKGSTDEAVKTQGQKETPQEAEAVEAVQAEGGETVTGETDVAQKQQPETDEMIRPETDMAADIPVENELPEEGLEQLMEILQSAILQIQELLTQQLNISPQELEQLMRQKGFTDVQLLQPETVSQLILDATGAEDSMALVMDEDLYQSQQTIIQGFQEITQKLETELKEEGGLQKTLESLKSLENGVESQTVQESGAAEENFRQENQEQPEQGREHESAQSQHQNTVGQVLYQNYTSQAQSQAVTGQPGAVTFSSGAAYAQTPETQQVMDQILDYMKVSMKPEDTVLNMQLHPENLGTLHIQISAREGVMTAHFTATSEAVKTVLENQMVVLRENFEQQDIKVDAIEVTVETHQFESNLEQGRNRGEEEQGRRPRRRRLDMSGLESAEELPEQDKIVAEMMAANGSSVDYLV